MSLAEFFPGLASFGAFAETSPADQRYNCIAWAAGDTTRWWWPDPFGQKYWPRGAPHEPTIAAFVAAFRMLGYEPVSDGTIEPDYEKIAIFAKDLPTHAARQLPDGRWTSKLGESIDIAHLVVEGVEGPIYGHVVQFMSRRREPASSS